MAPAWPVAALVDAAASGVWAWSWSPVMGLDTRSGLGRAPSCAVLLDASAAARETAAGLMSDFAATDLNSKATWFEIQ